MDREIVFDRPLQLPRAAMGPSADLFFREGGKPSFNQIEPGSARGGEVHMEAWPLGQPRTNGRRFVRAVVVQDQVNIQRFRDGLVDSIQELPKLDSPMPPMALPDHLCGFHIQGGKKRRRPIASVVMGAPFSLSGAHRQNGLSTIQRLNLGLLIDAQDQSTLGRIEVQAHNVPDFLNKERIRGELEGLATMRLQGKGAPDTTDRTLAQPGGCRHRTGAPVGRISRGGFQCHGDHSFYILIRDGSRGTGPWFVQQAVQPIHNEPTPPLADGLPRHLKRLGHLAVGSAGCTGKHDPCPARKRLRGFRSSRPPKQRFSLFLGQRQGSKRTSHVDPPFSPVDTRRTLVCQRIYNSGH